MRNRGKNSVLGGEVSARWSGELRVMQRLSEYEFGVELKILRDGVNNNKWDFRNLDRYYQTFAGTPILTAYVGGQVGDGHNSSIAIDPRTGQEYRSYMGPTAERIVGCISDDPKDLSLRKEGDFTWIVAKGRLWRVYAPELVEKIVRTGRMEISAETNVRDVYTENGVEVFPAWEGLGVTILGDHVAPAVPGANIQAIAALEQEFKTMKLRVASLNTADSGRKQYQKNPNEKGVNQQMSNNKTMAKELAKKFPNHRVLAFSPDGRNVCLMANGSNETFVYTFPDGDKAVVEAAEIQPVTLSAQVETCGAVLSVDVNEVMDCLSEKVSSLTKACEDKEAELETLRTEKAQMQAKETARRVKASRQAALDQLREININRAEAEQIPESSIQAVLDAAERGDYTLCADQNEDWDGESRVRSAVRDVAMQMQMELDKNRAEASREAHSKHYAFETCNSEGRNDNSLEGLYARITG